MKKILTILAVLILGTVCTAGAHTITADPGTTNGAASHVWPVRNDSSTAFDEGDVVVWDIINSTGNNDLHVATTTTLDTGIVAGVVGSGGIAALSNGSIIVFGLAQCDVSADVGDGSLLCTSATAGSGKNCSLVADEAQAYAIASEAGGSGSTVDCFVTGR